MCFGGGWMITEIPCSRWIFINCKSSKSRCVGLYRFCGVASRVCESRNPASRPLSRSREFESVVFARPSQPERKRNIPFAVFRRAGLSISHCPALRSSDSTSSRGKACRYSSILPGGRVHSLPLFSTKVYIILFIIRVGDFRLSESEFPTIPERSVSRSFRLSDSRNFRLSASMTVMVLSMVFPPDFVSNVSIKPLAFNREMTSTAVCRFTPK